MKPSDEKDDKVMRSKPQKKAKAGHQPLLTRDMNVWAQIDLIDYQSMPDGSYNYVLDYQDHDIKFCQLRALTQMMHHTVALLSSSKCSAFLDHLPSSKLIMVRSSVMGLLNLAMCRLMKK